MFTRDKTRVYFMMSSKAWQCSACGQTKTIDMCSLNAFHMRIYTKSETGLYAITAYRLYTEKMMESFATLLEIV